MDPLTVTEVTVNARINVAMLTEVIQHTFDRGGSVVIPSFAVGRTQEMLYFIRQIKEEGRVHGHDNFKVYVDSPLANEATTIFNEHIYDCFDEEAMALVKKGINPLMFPGLKTSITSEIQKQSTLTKTARLSFPRAVCATPAESNTI